MHFAVTGGAGFVGSNLVKLLVEEGHKIIVIENKYILKLYIPLKDKVLMADLMS